MQLLKSIKAKVRSLVDRARRNRRNREAVSSPREVEFQHTSGAHGRLYFGKRPLSRNAARNAKRARKRHLARKAAKAARKVNR